MKILNVVPALNQGGVEMVVAESAIFLAQAGHDSYVLSEGGQMVADLVEKGVKPICLPIEKKTLKTLFQIRQIARLIEDLQLDIVHTHSRLPAWLIYFALKLVPKNKRPITVSTIHGLHSISKYSAIVLKSDAIITVSQAAEKYYAANYLYKKTSAYLSRFADQNIVQNSEEINMMRKIHVFPLGVDLKQFTTISDDSDAVIIDQLNKFSNEKIPTIALVGRVTRLKGHIYLINVINALKNQNIRANAFIVGGIDSKNIAYLNELKSLISEKKLGDCVFFLDNCKNIPALFRQIDVTLSVSNKAESYGRIVLESLRAGTPVVGWNIGGIGENLTQFYPNGLVAFKDERELFQVLKHLIINKEAHSLEARYELSHSITIDSSQHHEQVLNLYKHLLAQKHCQEIL